MMMVYQILVGHVIINVEIVIPKDVPLVLPIGFWIILIILAIVSPTGYHIALHLVAQIVKLLYYRLYFLMICQVYMSNSHFQFLSILTLQWVQVVSVIIYWVQKCKNINHS